MSGCVEVFGVNQGSIITRYLLLTAGAFIAHAREGIVGSDAVSGPIFLAEVVDNTANVGEGFFDGEIQEE